MIECLELVKSYKKKRVVDNLSFSVKKGEVFAFLGSNGAGNKNVFRVELDR